LNRDTVIKGLLAVSVIGPALALGAVHAPVLAACGILGAGLLAYLAADRSMLSSARMDLAGYLFLGLAVFTGLQMIPLPSGVVELLSPAAHELRAGAVRPLGLEAPSFMPLTLDVPLTALELGKLVFYCAVYLAAMVWTRRNGSGLVLGLVVAAGVAAAFVFLAHKIFMADEIYGFYRPVHASVRASRISAPLINENHMSALLGLAATVSVGMAVSAADRSRRVLMVGISALLGGSLLLTLSRGGIAAFVIGQLLFIFLRLVRRFMARRTDDSARRQIAWLPLGLAFSLALGLFVAQDAIVGEFLTGNHQKIDMLKEGLPLIGRFPATGVGRGAFWVGFSQVSSWDSAVTFTHAENSIVQLLSDWGILVGGIALLGFGFLAARLLVRPPERIRTAAILAALVAFGAHNLVDFNMEIPGVAVVAAALLGALCGSSAAREGRGRKAPSGRGRPLTRPILLAGAAAALATSALVGTYAARYSLDNEERALRVAIGRRDRAQFGESRLAPLLTRHPASWYLPFIAGVHVYRLGRDNPLPWFSRALEVNPDSASAHLYVGRTLLRAGRLDQAMLEMRLASRSDPRLARPIAGFLVSASDDFGVLSRVAADDRDRHLLWEALANELSSRSADAQAEAADNALLGLDPPHPRAIARHARRAAAKGRIAEALELADRLARVDGNEVSAAVLRSEILARDGRDDEALAHLAGVLAAFPDSPELIRTTARTYQRAGRHGKALELAGRLKSVAADSRALAAASVFEGDLEIQEGRTQAAMACFRQAHALAPNDIPLLGRIADLAEKADDGARALDALRKLVALDPENGKWRARLAALEEDMIRKSRGIVEP